jgi:hypothetical protein
LFDSKDKFLRRKKIVGNLNQDGTIAFMDSSIQSLSNTCDAVDWMLDSIMTVEPIQQPIPIAATVKPVINLCEL